MYCGRVKSYNPKQGYGFLDCPDAKACFGRDVFIHKAQMGELLGRFVGPGTKLDPKTLKMNVRFGVEINKSGMPQARDVSRLDSDGVGLEPEQEEVDVAPLLLPTAETVMASTAPDPALGDACDDDAARKGYKGRGGTIRILPDSEGSTDASPMLVALPVSTSSRSTNGNGARKAGRSTKKGGVNAKGYAPPEWFAGDGLALDVHSGERIDDDLACRVKRPPKQTASVANTIDSKRRGHKDPYLQLAQQPQNLQPQQQQQQVPHPGSYDTRASVAFFQVAASPTQSPPLSPMGGQSAPHNFATVSPVFSMQEASSPTYAAAYQMQNMMSYPPHMGQVYGTTVQQYQGDTAQQMQGYIQYQGQHQVYGQLQPVHQAVPLSPQSSSHYAPSSPTLSPLPVSTTDGSGSPMSLSLPTATSIPHMVLPVTANAQDFSALLSMQGGVDQNGLHAANLGSPLNHYASEPDSDSDAGFSPLPPLTQGVEAFPGVCAGMWTD